MAGRILLVDDDDQIRTSLSEALEDFGFQVGLAESAEVALSAIGSSKPQIVLSDIGKGGHASMPHDCLDPIPVACEIVQAFQTFVREESAQSLKMPVV